MDSDRVFGILFKLDRVHRYHHGFGRETRRTQQYRDFLRECWLDAERGADGDGDGQEVLFGSEVVRAAGGDPYMHVSSALGEAMMEDDRETFAFLLDLLGSTAIDRPIHRRYHTERHGRMSALEIALFDLNGPFARMLVERGARLSDASVECIMRLCVVRCHAEFRALFGEYLEATQRCVAALPASEHLREIPLEVLGIVGEYATHTLPPFLDHNFKHEGKDYSCFQWRYETAHVPAREHTWTPNFYCCRGPQGAFHLSVKGKTSV